MKAQLAAAEESKVMVDQLREQISTMQTRLTTSENALVGAQSTVDGQTARMQALQAASQDAEDALTKSGSKYTELNEMLRVARRNAAEFENSAHESEAVLGTLKTQNKTLAGEVADQSDLLVFSIAKREVVARLGPREAPHDPHCARGVAQPCPELPVGSPLEPESLSPGCSL